MKRMNLDAILPGPWIFEISGMDAHYCDRRDEEVAIEIRERLKHGSDWVIFTAADPVGARLPTLCKGSLFFKVNGRHAKSGRVIVCGGLILPREHFSARTVLSVLRAYAMVYGCEAPEITEADLSKAASFGGRPVWLPLAHEKGEEAGLTTIAAYLDDDTGSTRPIGKG